MNGRTGAPVLQFFWRDVEYCLLDTGGMTVNQARARFVHEFDELLDRALETECPDVVLTYGSSEQEIVRRARIRARGCRVVLSVHNHAYRSSRSFEEVDVVLTPTRSLTEHYRRLLHRDSIPVPMAVDTADIEAPVRQPVFYTFVNPTELKGVHLFVRLLSACQEKLPDVMFLVVESRGSAVDLARAGSECGVNLARLTNFRIARNTTRPASFFAVTRVLLVPSLIEAGARIAVEAMINGIPVIASDRGGTPETVGTGGFILPAWRSDSGDAPGPIVDRWLKTIELLHRDCQFYAKASKAAYDATDRYRNGTVERERVALFESIATQSHDSGACFSPGTRISAFGGRDGGAT
jgi:glycosyltransferase involved in cell wall biosynthesis